MPQKPTHIHSHTHTVEYCIFIDFYLLIFFVLSAMHFLELDQIYTYIKKNPIFLLEDIIFYSQVFKKKTD